MEQIGGSNSEILLSYDITEVKRVKTISDANSFLKQGWKLLLVFPGDIADCGCLNDIYILGKPSRNS